MISKEFSIKNNYENNNNKNFNYGNTNNKINLKDNNLNKILELKEGMILWENPSNLQNNNQSINDKLTNTEEAQ